MAAEFCSFLGRRKREHFLRIPRKPKNLATRLAPVVVQGVFFKQNFCEVAVAMRTAEVGAHPVADIHRLAFFPSPPLQSSQ